MYRLLNSLFLWMFSFSLFYTQKQGLCFSYTISGLILERPQHPVSRSLASRQDVVGVDMSVSVGQLIAGRKAS